MRRTRTLLTAAVLVSTVAGCRDRPASLREAARGCHEDAELSCPRPIFNVHDLARSQRYYRDVLGFELDWQDGDPPDFASVSRADAVLFLCQGCQGTPGAWTAIFARDVDALHRELAARRALIRMPPRDMPWGLREMHVADPDGNVLRFGTGIDDD